VECALDASPYTACTSPPSVTRLTEYRVHLAALTGGDLAALTDGAHSFKVRAEDDDGNVNVVLSTFTVDTAPPAVSITGQPANPTNNANPAFTVSAEEGATLACSLTPSGGTDAFAPCRVPQSYSGLADGAYTFTVQATDAAGNVNVASYAFTVDTVAPAVPTGLTATASSVSEIDLSWTAATDTVGVAGYMVFRDGGTTPIGIVTTGTTFADTGLAPSSDHSYTVVAVDAAGNASAPSALAVATTLTLPATVTPTALPTTVTPTALPTTVTPTALPATPTDTATPVPSSTRRDAPSTTSVPPTSTPTNTAVLRTVANTPMPPTSTPTTHPATPTDTATPVPSSTPTDVPTTSHSTPAVASTRTAVPTATTAAQRVIADPTTPPTLPHLPNTGYGASATGADTRGNGALLSGALLGLLALAGGGVGALRRRSGPR
jgi:hypothetical protein